MLEEAPAVTNKKLTLEQPRALADNEAIPHKGTKSSITKFFSAKYGEKVIMPSFPSGWVPDSVILEEMFIINTTLLRIHCAACWSTPSFCCTGM